LSFSRRYGKLTVNKLTLCKYVWHNYKCCINNISCNILKLSSNGFIKWYGTNSEVLIIYDYYKVYDDILKANFTNIIYAVSGVVITINKDHPLYGETIEDFINKRDDGNLIKYCKEFRFAKVKSARNGSTQCTYTKRIDS
jgi:hypothetical protein